MSGHLFIIHFPVSMGVVAAILDLVGVGTGNRQLRDWAWRFLIAAAVAVFLAFATGEGARLDALAAGGVQMQPIESHQEWGSVGVWIVIGIALLRTFWRNHHSGIIGWVNLLAVLLCATLLTAITITGTLVRHGG